MLYLRWPAWPYYKVPPPTLPPDILLKAEVTADVHEFVDSNITSPDPPQGCLNNEYHCTYGGWAETNVDIKIFMINVLYVVMLGLIRGYKKYIYYIYLFIYLFICDICKWKWWDGVIISRSMDGSLGNVEMICVSHTSWKWKTIGSSLKVTFTQGPLSTWKCNTW